MPRRFPSLAKLLPDEVHAWTLTRRVARAAASGAKVVHFTHADCLDGAACDALVKLAYGPRHVATVWLEPAETVDALDALVAQEVARDGHLVLSDLSMQVGQGERAAAALRALKERGWRFEWRDHHHKQWSDDDLKALAHFGDVVVDTTRTECGATLVQKALLPHDAFAVTFAQVVRDHDLWLREDPRSETLQNAVVALGSEDFAWWMLSVRDVDDPRIAEKAAEADAARERDTAWGLEHTRVLGGGRGKVGVAFGNVPTNDILHHLLTEEGCDVAVLLKPSGAFSLRSRKGVDVCHVIAQEFGGGGHPNASGGHLHPNLAEMAVHVARGARSPVAKPLLTRCVEVLEAHLGREAGAAAS